MTADGWVRSGDLGHLLGDGNFVFETRMGDVLRLGGYLVAPSEIRGTYSMLSRGSMDARQWGAVGEDGPVVVAFVTLRPGVAFGEAALRQHYAKDLARFKTPARCVGTRPSRRRQGPTAQRFSAPSCEKWRSAF